MAFLRRAKLLLLAFFSVILVISQNPVPGKDELYEGYSKAMELYNKATAIGNEEYYDEKKERELNQKALDQFIALSEKIPVHSSSFDSLRFHTSFTIGELFHYFENYPSALQHYSQAIAIKKKSTLPDSFLLRPYIYSGLIHYQQNRINTAALFFNMADSVQQKYNRPIRESERLYNTLGVIHYETGNFRLAKIYFQKALDLLPKSSPYYRALMTNYKINLGHIHLTLEEYEEANRIYHELLAYPINHNEIFLNLGIINLNLGAPGKALENFNQVKRENNAKLARLYNHIGKAFLNLEQFDSSRHYLQLALSSSHKNIADDAGYGSALKTMGDFYLAVDSPSKALEYFAAAIPHFYPSYKSRDSKQNPQKFTGVFSFSNVFSTLVGKAEAAHALYLKTKDLSWAVQELEAYQSSFKLVNYVERTYNSDEARIFINRYKYEVHGRPIDIAYELYVKTKDGKYLEALYYIDQQNKASVLALNQARVQQRSTRDTALIRQEKEIKASIARNLLKASQAKDSVSQAMYSREITDQEILLDRVQNKLSYDGISKTIPSLKQLQTGLLDGSTAILSFHLSVDKITILNIADDRLQTFQLDLPAGFHDDVRRYIQTVRDPSSIPATAMGSQLYSLMFDSLDLSSIDRLVIIPDDELNFLPFESLKDREGKYLFESYAIQYQYSTAVLKEEKGHYKKGSIISFAPFSSEGYRKDSFNFTSLPFSSSEVKELKGEKLLGKDATRSAFLENVSNYQVVHLATHAVAGEGAGRSFILFANSNSGSDLLLAEDIYNLELKNTNLVFLSACETGAGKLVKGEGVMSLSRAFTYAGCPNIVTSLWKADDMSTSYLAKRIHHYLSNGLPVDRAVQSARKDFFNDPKIHPSYRHPYYWSHLVFIGNYEPGKRNWLWWIGGGLLLGIVLLVIRRKVL